MRTAEASTCPRTAAPVFPAASRVVTSSCAASSSAGSGRIDQLPSGPTGPAVPITRPSLPRTVTVEPGSARPLTSCAPTVSSVAAAGAERSTVNSRSAVAEVEPPAEVTLALTRYRPSAGKSLSGNAWLTDPAAMSAPVSVSCMDLVLPSGRITTMSSREPARAFVGSQATHARPPSASSAAFTKASPASGTCKPVSDSSTRPRVGAETLPLASRATACKAVSAASGEAGVSTHPPSGSTVTVPRERPAESETSTSLPGVPVPAITRPLPAWIVGLPGTAMFTGCRSASSPPSSSGVPSEAWALAEVATKLPSAAAVTDWMVPSGKVMRTLVAPRAWPKTIRRPSAATSWRVTTIPPSSSRFSGVSSRKVRSALEAAACRACNARSRPWSTHAAAAGDKARLAACPVRPACSSESDSARLPPCSRSTPESLARTSPTRSAADRPSEASKAAEFVGTAPPMMSTPVSPKALATPRLAASMAATSAGGWSPEPTSRRAASSVSGLTSTVKTVAPVGVVLYRGLDSATTSIARSVVSRDRGAAVTSST